MSEDSKLNNELIERLKESVISELKPLIENIKSNNDLGLLTRDDVLNIFKINKSTLIRWQREKTLPFIKIRGRVYFKRSEIEAIIDNQENNN